MSFYTELAAEWTDEGLWNAAIGDCRSPEDVRTEAKDDGVTPRQWIRAAVKEAREQGMDDPRPDDEIAENLITQAKIGPAVWRAK